jgi:hypothetical protein
MRKIEKIHRKKKKAYFEEQMKQKKTTWTKRESGRMYRLVNDVRKEFKPYMTAGTDINGMIMNEPCET